MKGLNELLLWVLTSFLLSWLVMSSLPIWQEIPDGRRKQGAAKGDAGSDIFRINTQLGCSSSAVNIDLITFSSRTKCSLKSLGLTSILDYFFTINLHDLCLAVSIKCNRKLKNKMQQNLSLSFSNSQHPPSMYPDMEDQMTSPKQVRISPVLSKW